MEKKVQESIDDILSQIDAAKKNGKHMIKVKTFQCDFRKLKNGNTVPCNIFTKVGMYSGGDGEKALLNMGYSISYEKTTKQATARVKCGQQFVTIRPLNTTNMVVRW